jgi:hypothetical protein
MLLAPRMRARSTDYPPSPTYAPVALACQKERVPSASVRKPFCREFARPARPGPDAREGAGGLPLSPSPAVAAVELCRTRCETARRTRIAASPDYS